MTLAAVLVAPVLSVSPASSAEVFSLRAGDAAFWKGPHVEDGSDTWVYRLHVLEDGYRLRVGLDHPEVGDSYTLTVTDPSGSARNTVRTGTGLYSVESLHRDPARGTWRIEVRANDVSDTAFRMRAKLEAQRPALGTRRGPVLPNLQVLPPHEPSFLFPVTNGAGDTEPTGVPVPTACHPEEHAKDQVIRCLRFAFGIRNTGRGPLYLTYSGSPPANHQLIQRVMRGDDTYFERDAGTAHWHESHGHYHHGDAVELQLFEVTNRDRGKLAAVGEPHRKGFAHRDELLRDWDTFYPTWDKYGFGLLAGWSDIYEWDRPGNYIGFPITTDGYYVLRMMVDPVRGILESNRQDNRGYTYFSVSGTEVEMIEAGRGRDPWDPCKIVVGFGGHPDPPRSDRPSRCPADTT